MSEDVSLVRLRSSCVLALDLFIAYNKIAQLVAPSVCPVFFFFSSDTLFPTQRGFSDVTFF